MKVRTLLLFLFPFIALTSCVDSEQVGSSNAAVDQEKNQASTNANQNGVNKGSKSARILSPDFKAYWYDGNAEITSYKLSQERYGELRDGTAVTIFVTEDFLKDTQVKADNPSEENIAVLKLNSTKKFNTGIYPYSIMTSVFSPVLSNEHALKMSHSMQEWCGQVYMQLNNKKAFEILSHSYFEGEADQLLSLEKAWLESELWNLIRIEPDGLPTGDLKIIPAFEYLRMHHKKPAIHTAFAKLTQGDSLSTYEIEYPELRRQLTIHFNSSFPFEIEKWEEINAPWRGEGEALTTTAVAMKRIKSAYWGQNSKQYESLRDSLQLN